MESVEVLSSEDVFQQDCNYSGAFGMVNTGKPSTACFECRRRRIKCDTARPECERCIKHGTQCPGYPDNAQVVFRDHTKKTQQRAIKKYEKTGTVFEDSTLSARSQSNLNDAAEGSSSAPVVPATLDEQGLKELSDLPVSSRLLTDPPVNDSMVHRAIAAFIDQWTTSDPEVFWAAFDCISVLYPTALQSEGFSSALEAISLLAIALTEKEESGDVRRATIKSYGQTLRCISSALEDPLQRTTDHTFMAVELVCLFEICTGFESATDRAQMHLRGVLTLAKMRGREQFATTLGQRLFLTACVLWSISTVIQPSPISMDLPPDLWPALFEYDLGSHEPTFRLFPMVDRAAEVRRLAVQTLSPARARNDLTTLILLLAQVDTMDQEFTAWHHAHIKRWSSHDDFLTIFTNNISHCHRIFLQDVKHQVYKHLTQLDEDTDYSTQLEQCVNTIRQLVDSICATMPSSLDRNNPKARAEEMGDLTIALQILFSPPLLVASMVLTLSDEQKNSVEAAMQALRLAKPSWLYEVMLLRA